MGNSCLCGLQVAELRCSRASVFVEHFVSRMCIGQSFGILACTCTDVVHRAVLLNHEKLMACLRIPRTFHVDSLLHGFSFCGECRISYRVCTSVHRLETQRVLGESQNFLLRFLALWL